MSACVCGERCDGDGVGVQMMDAEEHGRGSGGTTAVRANPARSAPRLRHRSGSPGGPEMDRHTPGSSTTAAVTDGEAGPVQTVTVGPVSG